LRAINEMGGKAARDGSPQKMRQIKNLERHRDSKKSESALGSVVTA